MLYSLQNNIFAYHGFWPPSFQQIERKNDLATKYFGLSTVITKCSIGTHEIFCSTAVVLCAARRLRQAASPHACKCSLPSAAYTFDRPR